MAAEAERCPRTLAAAAAGIAMRDQRRRDRRLRAEPATSRRGSRTIVGRVVRLPLSGDTLGFVGAALLLLGGAFAWWHDATALQSVAAVAPGYVLLLVGAAAQRRERAGYRADMRRFVVAMVLATGLALGFDVAVGADRPSSFAFFAAIFIAVVGLSDRFYMRPPGERSPARADRR